MRVPLILLALSSLLLASCTGCLSDDDGDDDGGDDGDGGDGGGGGSSGGDGGIERDDIGFSISLNSTNYTREDDISVVLTVANTGGETFDAELMDMEAHSIEFYITLPDSTVIYNLDEPCGCDPDYYTLAPGEDFSKRVIINEHYDISGNTHFFWNFGNKTAGIENYRYSRTGEYSVYALYMPSEKNDEPFFVKRSNTLNFTLE